MRIKLIFLYHNKDLALFFHNGLNKTVRECIVPFFSSHDIVVGNCCLRLLRQSLRVRHHVQHAALSYSTNLSCEGVSKES